MDLAGSRLDHLDRPVRDLERAVAFFEAALAPPGIVTLVAVPATPAAQLEAVCHAPVVDGDGAVLR